MKIDPEASPLDKLPPILKQDLDKNLCTCMDVPKMDIINAIVNGATTVEEVKKQTCAATGAGCCVQQVERLIECLCAPAPRRGRNRRKMREGSGKMIGKKFLISGMRIEIVSDKGDKWETRNITTNDTVLFDKAMLEKAIKLGKAEELSSSDEIND